MPSETTSRDASVEPASARLTLRKYLYPVLGLAALMLATYWVAKLWWLPLHNPWDRDFMTLWLAGKFAWLGEDPYNTQVWTSLRQRFGATWVPDPHLVYPLPLVFFMAPLGLFSVGKAYCLWLAFTNGVVGIVSWGTQFSVQDPRRAFLVVPLLLGSLIFRPVQVALFHGQLTPLLLLAFFLAWMLIRTDRGFWGGLVLTLTLLKPNGTFIAVGLLGLFWVFSRRWAPVLGILAGGTSLFLLGAVKDPGWVSQFLALGGSKIEAVYGGTPTLWGLAGVLCDHAPVCVSWAGGLGSAMALAFAVLVFWLGRSRMPQAWAFSLAISTGILVFPYLWAYEQMLLLFPLCLISYRLLERGVPFLTASLVMILFSFSALLFLSLAMRVEHDYPNGLLTLQTLLLLVWIIWTEPKSPGSAWNSGRVPQHEREDVRN